MNFAYLCKVSLEGFVETDMKYRLKWSFKEQFINLFFKNIFPNLKFFLTFSQVCVCLYVYILIYIYTNICILIKTALYKS